MSKSIKLGGLALGIVFLLNAVYAAIYSDTGLGVILTLVCGLVLILTVAALGQPRKLIKCIFIFILAIFLALLALGGYLYVVGGNDTATFEEDACIVLGTTVKGHEPTDALKNRLDAAIEYHEKNPSVPLIVTGGQGTDENDPEALVMANYLISKGIPADIIIKEDRATITVENFAYAREFLTEDMQICYISNDFHIYRAGKLAGEAGFVNATSYSGKTPWYVVIPNAFRESIVVLKMWFID